MSHEPQPFKGRLPRPVDPGPADEARKQMVIRITVGDVWADMCFGSRHCRVTDVDIEGERVEYALVRGDGTEGKPGWSSLNFWLTNHRPLASEDKR